MFRSNEVFVSKDRINVHKSVISLDNFPFIKLNIALRQINNFNFMAVLEDKNDIKALAFISVKNDYFNIEYLEVNTSSRYKNYGKSIIVGIARFAHQKLYKRVKVKSLASSKAFYLKLGFKEIVSDLDNCLVLTVK